MLLRFALIQLDPMSPPVHKKWKQFQYCCSLQIELVALQGKLRAIQSRIVV